MRFTVSESSKGLIDDFRITTPGGEALNLATRPPYSLAV
jgi:hypothetical protein